ncbi:hypothetical protein A4R29_05225 [Mesorhizobium ciceri biovar biserrulae]|nr:hypothetical protein A4R29_05225 [Mesorhizobium ciceri biovar biserrulae]
MTSLVGATPYFDQVLRLTSPRIIAEYTKILSYSLMASRDASFSMATKVVGHPVALQEVAGVARREHAPRRAREPWGSDMFPG